MPTGLYKRKPMSEETKKKISKANKGRIGCWLGKKMPDEIRKKIKESKMGDKNPMFGKSLTKEHKDKISKSLKGKNTWAKGVKMSIETRIKISNSMKGENTHLWKGGISPENKTIRRGVKYKLWRESVFERDNYTCKKTGQFKGDLVVHHINNFAEFPELRFDPDNGVTLSKKSHDEFHKIYGKQNNTKKQLEEYLQLTL